MDDLTTDEFRALAKKAVESFGTHKLDRRRVGAVRRAAHLRAAERRPGGPDDGGQGGGGAARGGRPPPALPVGAAEGRPGGDRDAARRRPRRELPGGHGEAVRARPGAARSKLNDFVHETFDESQIFRIDHFLGKEAAQNILAFRFANGLFEPIWNRNFIDHVQIDIPETLGLDQRANFYESTGAYKDMVVTHLMQVMAFVAMEPPTALEPRAISEEKNKVFRSMLPIHPRDVVRGQYGGYREREGRGPRLGHRDVHRAEGRHRQLALGGRAVLPAHRQEDGRGPCGSSRSPSRRRRGRCSRRAPGSAAGAGPPDVRPRRRLAGVAVVLRQAPGPGDAAGEAVDAVLHAGDRTAPATSSRPTSG